MKADELLTLPEIIMTIPSLHATALARVATATPPTQANKNNLDPQLPVHSYFDADLLIRERKLLFDQGPMFLAHESQIPEPNDYLVVDDYQGRILTNDSGSIRLISNVCKHRQALILNGRGNSPQIVCPLHRWTYANDGTLLGAPHFSSQPCASLRLSTPLQSWQGLLFAPTHLPKLSAELAQMSCASIFDFSSYRWHSGKTHHCDYNWKTFIEVYLEDYHVEPFHPGLGNFVSCDDLSWQFAPRFSVQTVGIKNALNNPHSTVYSTWQNAVKQYFGDNLPTHGAVWLLIYPNIMVEFYPGTLVISTLSPQSAGLTVNRIDFFYLEEIALFEPDFVAAQQAAYQETMIEDDEIAKRMDQGRLALLKRGANETGPYQSPMEDGMKAFHQWYREQLFSE